MEYVTKIVNEYNDIVRKLTPAEVRIQVAKRNDVGIGRRDKIYRDKENLFYVCNGLFP